MTNRKIRLYLLGRLWCSTLENSFNCVLIPPAITCHPLNSCPHLLATFFISFPLESRQTMVDLLLRAKRKQSGATKSICDSTSRAEVLLGP